uniref:hypothetical protein n=1 Tax=Weissella soli TaxID=155866 RepID=UPI0035A0AA91
MNRYMTIIGGVLLLLTTPLVPWNWLFNHIHGLSTIQFPFRFLPFATAFLIVGMGMTLTQLIRYFNSHKASKWPVIRLVQFPIILMAAISVLMAADQLYVATQPWTTGDVVRSRANVTQDVSNEELKQSFSNTHPLGVSLDNVWKSTSDYVPLPSAKIPEHPYGTYAQEIAIPRRTFTRSVYEGELYIKWQQKRAGWQAVNVVKYAHTQLVLNKKTLSNNDVKLSEIGAVRVYGQAGENVLQVRYHPQWFMQWGFTVLIVSWITWLGLLIYRNYVN